MNLVVWLDVAEVAEREMAGRLCRRHANALVVPRGWSLDDRRVAVPGLFRVVDMDPPAPKNSPATAARQKRKPKLDDVDTPSLFESIRRELEPETVEEVPAAAPAADGEPGEQTAVDPDETQAIPWSPSLRRSAPAEDEDAPKFGRLLGRAFGDGGKPQ